VTGGLPTVPGNYKLIQYAGATPGLGNFVLPAAPAGQAQGSGARRPFGNR